MENINYKNFFYPPGGILIWIIILVELITFCAGLTAFIWQRAQAKEIFELSQNTLNTKIGLVNTLLLLTSGYLVAEAVRFLRIDNTIKSQRWMSAALIFGIGFLFLKSLEYYAKFQQGFDLSYNMFYTHYWLITGFHFFHVLVGIIILSVLTLKIRKGIYGNAELYDVESGASFWHLCDLIWLLVFPIIYLL